MSNDLSTTSVELAAAWLVRCGRSHRGGREPDDGERADGEREPSACERETAHGAPILDGVVVAGVHVAGQTVCSSPGGRSPEKRASENEARSGSRGCPSARSARRRPIAGASMKPWPLKPGRHVEPVVRPDGADDRLGVGRLVVGAADERRERRCRRGRAAARRARRGRGASQAPRDVSASPVATRSRREQAAVGELLGREAALGRDHERAQAACRRADR